MSHIGGVAAIEVSRGFTKAPSPPAPPAATGRGVRAATIAAVVATLTIASGASAQGEPALPALPPSPTPPVVAQAPAPAQDYERPRIIWDWEPGDPIPPGYQPATRSRTGLVVGGSILFGTFYLISNFAAAVGSDAHLDSGALYIPAIGPFIQLAKSDTATERFFSAIDGLAQCGGIAMVIYGIAEPRHVLLRNAYGLTIRPVPLALRGGGGFGFGGTF